MIELLYFARLREALGTGGEQLESTPATVSDLLDELKGRGEPWSQVLSGKVLVAVNQEMALSDTPLNDGDEVGLFPPVTGG
jgi:molybdopterin synthase sulfur carrier subunit